MKYRLRINENPKLEAEVKHTEIVNDTTIIVDDIGDFGHAPKEGVKITKFELIGEDGEIYAMRRLPKHLLFNWSISNTLSIHFKLTLDKELV